jgi:hypothetical protein
MDLLATSLVLFALSAVALAVSLASGKSILVYSSVSRDKEPVAFWIAVGILGLMALVTAITAVWGFVSP